MVSSFSNFTLVSYSAILLSFDLKTGCWKPAHLPKLLHSCYLAPQISSWMRTITDRYSLVAGLYETVKNKLSVSLPW